MVRVKEFCVKSHSTVVPISLKHVKLAVQAYYPIVYTEFYSATRKYDGRKYGLKFEDAAGEEALRRVIGDRLISDAEFERTVLSKGARREASHCCRLCARIYRMRRNYLAYYSVPSTPHW